MATVIVVLSAVGCYAAKREEPATLRFGMPIETARRIIARCDMDETALARETPAISDEGVPLASIDLQDGGNGAITLVYEDVAEGRVVRLASCDHMDQPQSLRKWIDVNAVDLRAR